MLLVCEGTRHPNSPLYLLQWQIRSDCLASKYNVQGVFIVDILYRWLDRLVSRISHYTSLCKALFVSITIKDEKFCDWTSQINTWINAEGTPFQLDIIGALKVIINGRVQLAITQPTFPIGRKHCTIGLINFFGARSSTYNIVHVFVEARLEDGIFIDHRIVMV